LKRHTGGWVKLSEIVSHAYDGLMRLQAVKDYMEEHHDKFYSAELALGAAMVAEVRASPGKRVTVLYTEVESKDSGEKHKPRRELQK
jgi:hypothetical protein